jgi:hypothetical protein
LTADAPDGYAPSERTGAQTFPEGMMAQKLEDVQERLCATPEPILSQDEILRRAGVSIPTMRDIAPFEPVRLRPRWLAFLIRLFA